MKLTISVLNSGLKWPTKARRPSYQKAKFYPKIPSRFLELVVSDEQTTTGEPDKGKIFLLYGIRLESYAASMARVIITDHC